MKLNARRRLPLIVEAALLLASWPQVASASQSILSGEYDPHRVIIKFRARSNLLARTASGTPIPQFERVTPLRRNTGSRTEPLAGGVERIFVAEIPAGSNSRRF